MEAIEEEPIEPEEDLVVEEETPLEAVEEEFLEEVDYEEIDEDDEAIIEEFEAGEVTEEAEVPSTSLAELYIKQDLFDEAINIYRQILDKNPSNNSIRQVLEETNALQAFVEGRE